MHSFAVKAALCIVAAASIAIAGDPASYHKKATWHETMRASREASIGDVERSALTTGPWYAIGPFVAATGEPFHEAFPPEKEVALNQAYRDSLHWIRRPEWKDGIVTMFRNVEHSATYLYRTIDAVRESTVTAYFGSDDGLTVWLNGDSILADDASRSCNPNQDEGVLHLRKGKNDLLLKISNSVSETGFYFSLSPTGTGWVWQLLERDFRDSVSVMEMSWEQQDSIWETDWRPGDAAELGRRYERAYRRSVESRVDSASPEAVTVGDERSLASIREKYLASRWSEYVILTPKASVKPRINSARAFGVRPGHPLLFTVAATGERPMRFTAKGLPDGLHLNEQNGRISGTVDYRGRYPVKLTAHNGKGMDERTLIIVVGDTLALTPPMGWNSWYVLENRVTQADMIAAAEAMVSTGMINHGYAFINIDDCWAMKPGSPDPMLQGNLRDERGRVRPNGRFPDMKMLTDAIHAKGLKAGIYTSPGPLTCAGYTGAYQHEASDARQFADWGFDFLKYDWCTYGTIAKNQSVPELKRPYAIIAPLLRSQNRDIILNLCQYGMGNVWEWGAEYGHSWRTTGDLGITFQGIPRTMFEIGFGQNGLERWAGPGHWNDPDYLLLGYISNWRGGTSPTPLRPGEQYTYVSLWCMLASPLFFSGDMTRLDPFTLSLLTNDEVIEIDQDPLGRQGHRVSKDGELEVWMKELENGSRAVALFNRGEQKAAVTARWKDLGISGKQTVRDLWRQEDLGAFSDSYSSNVPRHGVRLVKLTPAK